MCAASEKPAACAALGTILLPLPARPVTPRLRIALPAAPRGACGRVGGLGGDRWTESGRGFWQRFGSIRPPVTHKHRRVGATRQSRSLSRVDQTQRTLERVPEHRAGIAL